MLDEGFYNLMMEAAGALGRAMQAARSRSMEQTEPPLLLRLRAGRAESPGWFLLQATEFDPDPLSIANLRRRDVYASKRIVQALLELMASEGWFDRTEQDVYSLTAVGRGLLRRARERREALLAEVAPSLDGDDARLAALLGRLIDASLDGATPPGTWCLAHSRNRAPEAGATPLARVAQYFDDVNAFRDDAHMAAWQPLGVEGVTWEAFATLYRGDAHTVDSVLALLAYRGYSRSDYAAALREAAARGWLEPGSEAGAYSVTETGRLVHAEVERLTDRYFYAPWSCLSQHEITQLHELLVRVRDRLSTISD